ncbi:MAG: hypothetical protein ACM3PP_08400, partial [Candidatus Saccharibacteria bacterium]
MPDEKKPKLRAKAPVKKKAAPAKPAAPKTPLPMKRIREVPVSSDPAIRFLVHEVEEIENILRSP